MARRRLLGEGKLVGRGRKSGGNGKAARGINLVGRGR